MLDWLYELQMNRFEQYLAHLIVGMVIQLIFWKWPKVGFIITLAAGISKEFIDKSNHGQFDWLDIFFTVLGAVMILIIKWFKKQLKIISSRKRIK